MDVTHVLLGRPWLYGHQSLQDGYKNTYTFYKDNAKIVLGPTHGKINTKPTLLGDVSNFSGDICDEKTQKEEIMEDIDDEDAKDDLNSPPIFDEYVKDDIQEINLENQIFEKGRDEQVDVAESQVVIEFVPKPECILPMVNIASEFVPKQECKPQIVTLEDRLNSEYVDPFWEAIEPQQEASKQVCEVANQIESPIPTTTAMSVQHHEDNLKRQTELQAPPQKCHKKRKHRHKWPHEEANSKMSSSQPGENDAEIDEDLIYVMAEACLAQLEQHKIAHKGPDKF
eukprot:TRINITY_DN13983_c0_g4_i1.p1 TRINITY_DN13983_c0_g4~~TRINITY_DN13983_c0_g4_i1.p1  ORF type:complete len:299 (+),score=64.51 TRINITY_DN13983_c0_g4_i1:48-899(+)